MAGRVPIYIMLGLVGFLITLFGLGHTRKSYQFGYFRLKFNIKEANDYCKSLNGYLMEINSRAEFEIIRNIIIAESRYTRFNYTIYLGGNDLGHEGVWTWYNSGKNVTDDLKWAVGEPDNWRGNENCMIVDSWRKFQLNDIDCHEPGLFLCEIQDFGLTRSYHLGYYQLKFNIKEANYFCKSLNGYLAEINSREEFEIIRNIIIDESRKTESNDTIFLGGNDLGHEGVWTWYNSGKDVMDDLKWDEGEPDNWRGNENCMIVDSWENYQLNDIDCHAPGKFLCEIPDFGPENTNKSYQFGLVLPDFNLEVSNDYCKSLNGYLAEINSREEFEIIRKISIESGRNYNYIFLGGNDIGHEGVWTWYYSGQNAIIDNRMWAEGQPNNSHGHENCMVVDRRQKYQLNDFHCGGLGTFLCEIPDFGPGHTQKFYLFKYPFEKFDIKNANDVCKDAIGGYLMEINSREEYQIIREMIVEKNPEEPVFIGGNDIGHEGVWKWYNSGKNVNDNLKWAKNQPDNWQGHENCMAVDQSQGYHLNDLDCHQSRTFLCEMPNNGPEIARKTYHLGFYKLQFDIMVSNDFCKDLDGYLVEINSREEYETIRKVLIDYKHNNRTVFIGGYYDGWEGVWKWYNSFQNAIIDNHMWAEGQPDNHDGHENCIIVDPWQNFQLNNFDCDEPGTFLCEIPYVGPFHAKKFHILHYPWNNFSMNVANNFCRLFINGHLMEINSREEYRIMREMMIEKNPEEQVFLGGYDYLHEGVWKWYNSGQNAIIDNRMWARGQPDNHIGKEDCMTVDPFQHFHLNDVQCRGPGKILCEIPDSG